jgi:S-adenosylmethionine hydrolase
MTTVALLTDFGIDSFYVGVMKSVLASAAPGATVIDITHAVEPQAVAQASFVLDCVFDWFAPGTVFVAVVDPGVGSSRRALVVDVGGRRIVGPDNGISAEVVSRHGTARAVVIDPAAVRSDRVHDAVGRTFAGRDVFAPAAAALARGAAPASLGTPADGIEPLGLHFEVETGEGWVRGTGRFVDPFGNVLTNVTADRLDAVFGGRGGVVASVDGRDVGPLHEFYAERSPGTLMAVVDSWGLVEIAVNQGRAIDALGGAAPESLSIELRVER